MPKLLQNIIRNPIARRWVDIILLSIFTIILTSIFKPQLYIFSLWIKQFTSHWSTLLTFSTIALVSCILSLILIHIGSLHYKFIFRLKTIFLYPPFWISIMISILIISFVWLIEGQIPISLIVMNINPLLMCFFSICIGLLISFIFNELSASSTSSTDPVEENYLQIENKDIFGKDDALLSWIKKETPIRYPSEDLFGHTIIANRITRNLLGANSSSIGVVGPYGCGKSSLLNIIERAILHRKDIIICRVDTWGRNTGSIAQKILTMAIDKVKEHTDCASIISLPENYRKAISGTESLGGSIFSAILQVSHDPLIQLSKLNDILLASRFRLVIFLEDIDRNTDDSVIRDEMPALLDRLREFKQISFVLTIGTTHKYSDILIRICDHIEALA